MVNPVPDPSGSCPLLKHADHCPDPQRKRESCQTCEVDGKTMKMELLSNMEMPLYNWQILKKLSNNPAAKNMRKYRRLKKNAKLNVVSQDIQKFVDQSHAQSKRESHQTCEVGGKTVKLKVCGKTIELKPLSNTPSARRKRDYRWRKSGKVSRPPRQLSNHPAAQRSRRYRFLKKEAEAKKENPTESKPVLQSIQKVIS